MRAMGVVDLALLAVLSLIWGLSFFFIDLSLRELSPLWIGAMRTAGGGLVLFGLIAAGRNRLGALWRLWPHLLLLGTCSTAYPWVAVAWAQRSLDSGLTGLLMALVPISTLLVAAAARTERITVVRLGGLLLALGGVAIVAGADLDDTGRLTAILVVVSGTILYSLGAVYAKRVLSGTTTPLQLAAGQVLAAAVVITPVALLVDGAPPALATLRPATIGSLAMLGVASTGVAYAIYYTLLHRVGATNASLTAYLIPLVAVVAGATLLDERLGWPVVVSGALIAGGIWLAQRPQRRPALQRVVPPAA